MNEVIKIKVTIERFDEVIDLDDSFHLGEMNYTKAYEYLCQFVVNDAGEYVTPEEARSMFKQARIKRAEIGAYWLNFVQKVNEAYIPKVSGSESSEPF
jgi:hypothetical protein